MFNLKTKKIVISRDVIFNEKASWNWETSSEHYATILANEEINQEEDDANAEPVTPITPPQPVNASPPSALS